MSFLQGLLHVQKVCWVVYMNSTWHRILFILLKYKRKAEAMAKEIQRGTIVDKGKKKITNTGKEQGNSCPTVQVLRERNVGVVIRDEQDINLMRLRSPSVDHLTDKRPVQPKESPALHQHPLSLSLSLFMDSNGFGDSQRLVALVQQLRPSKPLCPPSNTNNHPKAESETNPIAKPSERTRPKRAAVLICLFEDENGHLRVILTKRASTLSTNSGDVSLPGGKTEEGDANDIETALREAKEEIGLDPSLVDIVTVLEPNVTKVEFLGFFAFQCIQNLAFGALKVLAIYSNFGSFACINMGICPLQLNPKDTYGVVNADHAHDECTTQWMAPPTQCPLLGLKLGGMNLEASSLVLKLGLKYFVFGFFTPSPLSQNGMAVVPVLGILADIRQFNPTPNAAEVEAIFDAPLDMFLKDKNRREEEREWMGNKYLLHFFDYEAENGKYVLWALTARILIAAASLVYQRPPDFQIA
ncbi:hypothetical protein RHSIM_Rhsim13G0185000 [Rhododendron simsii]|uniref:Nudix hydrolase domain-containing protein n=1 Tax=Rhododendron simsii TaxID=118357 RepID=A0A834L7V9_RHOSS|nr:hypothetical protein RHSIM_Rhsim13G0185000 [Rhododendron simsii]